MNSRIIWILVGNANSFFAQFRIVAIENHHRDNRLAVIIITLRDLLARFFCISLKLIDRIHWHFITIISARTHTLWLNDFFDMLNIYLVLPAKRLFNLANVILYRVRYMLASPSAPIVSSIAITAIRINR